MAVGYETSQVNSQLVNVAPGQGYAPLTFGSQYVGPDFWTRNGSYNVPPVVPSPGSVAFAGNSSAATSAAGSGSPPEPSAGSMDTAGNVNFLHPTKSPVVMAMVFLALGLFMLHKIHFRE